MGPLGHLLLTTLRGRPEGLDSWASAYRAVAKGSGKGQVTPGL